MHRCQPVPVLLSFSYLTMASMQDLPPASKHYVQLRDGCQIAVHDFGGSGPVLVVLHANGFHALAYLPLVDGLMIDFHCIGIDLRASGDSSRGTVDLSPVEFEQDVREIIELLDLRGCYVFGHSLGGASALFAHAADNSLFNGLYIYEAATGCFEFTEESIIEVLGSKEAPFPGVMLEKMALRRRNSFSSIEEATEVLSKRLPFSGFHPAALDAYVRHGLKKEAGGNGLSWKCDPKHEANIFKTFLNPAVHCQRISGPIMLSRGADSAPPHGFLHALTKMMTDHIQGAKFTEFEGLGHLGPMEDPDIVSKSIREYFLHLAASQIDSNLMSKM